MLWAYVDPDTILPLTSGLAAAVGFLMIVWRFVVRLLRATLFLVFRSAKKSTYSSHPIPEDCREKYAPPEVVEQQLSA